jgi:nitrite reductase (NO-forming)
MTPARRRLVIAVAVVLVVGLIGLAAFALAGGLDRVTTERVRGGGTKLVRVALVDAALGFDVTPDVVEVNPGTHLILNVVNEGDEDHNLALYGGATSTRMLNPGESQRLDVGTVTGDIKAWCTISGHKLFGMSVEIRVADEAPGNAGSP